MKEELRRDIDKFAEENREAIFRDIARLVSVNSVEAGAEPGAPFGRGVSRALELALQIAEELGLEAVDCQGMLGYAGLGRGDSYLATITHLDVVPSGEGWTGDPFVMSEREGYIIGRGVMDDKGPSVLCLYALKYFKDRGLPLRYPIRALLGLNEETGMKDVEYYLENYPAPLFCFSPDANFPLCNGEKGIYHGRVVSRLPLDRVVDIGGGVAANVIPDKAWALVRAEKLVSSERVEAAMEEEGLWRLTARGIGGHASHPEGTMNAIGLLVDYILDKGVVQGEERELFSFLRLCHSAWDGSALGVAARDELFEPLTIIGGVIGLEDGRIFQTLDSRYPSTTDGEKLTAAIQERAGSLAQVKMERDAKPFYMALDNPAVQACLKAYNDISGEDAKPYTIGGGTYAREFPNAVSFGPEHPERPQPDFAGPIHGADEAASMEYFMEALKVYILALIRLEELDF